MLTDFLAYSLAHVVLGSQGFYVLDPETEAADGSPKCVAGPFHGKNRARAACDVRNDPPPIRSFDDRPRLHGAGS